jgi:trigger factor
LAEPSAIQVTTTEEGPVRRTLQVEIPPEQVSRAFEHVFRDLAKHARVKGFRPGKVPRSVVQKLYGGTVTEEVERLLVSQSLEEAVDRSGVHPVVEPTIDAPPPVQGQAFSYRVGLEVKPEFALSELRGLPGRKPKLEVGEEDVARELEALRQRHAALVEEPEDVSAARGHVLTIDFTGRVDGEPFEGGSARGHELELGAGRLVPGFEEQLEGARAGSDVVVRVTFPQDYGNRELAGREAVFDVHVVSIRRRELPTLDDEFAKDLGEFESLAALRERIRTDLAAAAERRARAALERSVMDALIERTPFEVGPGLVDRQLRSRLSGAHRQLEASVPHDALHEQLARWQEEWRPQAEREVRETLLLEAVAREQGLEVDDAELEARLAAVAERQGADPKQVRRAYEERGLLEGLRGQLLEEKALAWLCAESKVEEIPQG